MSYIGNNPKVKALKLDTTNISTAPPAGQLSIYAKSDGNVYTKNSIGNETQLGAAGSSSKNYLSTWYAFASDPTSGIVTTLTSTGNRTSNTTVWGASTTGLLSYLTSGYLRAPGSAQFTLTSAQFIETPMFTVDAADLGRTLYISFDYNTSGTFAAGDILLQVVHYNSSGTYIETITPSVTSLPSSLSTVKASFQTSSTTTDQYSIRFVGNNASSRVGIIDSLIVGPQAQIAVGAQSPWVLTSSAAWSFSSGFGSVNPIQIWTRRNGSNLEARGRFNVGVTTGTAAYIQLPSTYTIDSSVLPSIAVCQVGEFTTVTNSTSNSASNFQIFYDGSTTNQLFFNHASSALTGGAYVKSGGSSFASNADNIDFWFSVPIANWGPGINLAPSATPEYVYNTSTATNADDTTSFGYGPQGTTFNGFTTSVNFRVRFQNAIQPTDRIQFEVFADGVWVPLTGLTYFTGTSSAAIEPQQKQSGSTYGIALKSVTGTTTDLDVNFGNYCFANGASYSAVGAAWSTVSNTSNAKWRVAKYPAAGLSELAPASSTGAGYLSTGTQTIAGTKTFQGGILGNQPLVTNFSAFSPAALSGANNNATSLSTQNNPSYLGISISAISSGTVTFTFANTGYYMVTLYGRGFSSTVTYTNAGFQFNVGGTSSQYNIDTALYGSGVPNSNNFANTFTFPVKVTAANQTLTVQFQGFVTGSGTASAFTFAGQVLITGM